MVATIARIPRPLRMLTGGLFALLAFFALSVAPAAAAPNPCVGSSMQQAANAPSCLPMERWSGATDGFHSVSSSSWMNPLGGLGVIQREFVAGGFMKGGNAIWGATSTLIQSASQYSPIDVVGGWVNETAGNLASTILDSPLFVGLFVVVLVMILAQTWRKNAGFPWKQLLTKIVLMGMFAVMASASMGTTYSDGAESEAPAKFERLSPGWILDTTNRTITSVASSVSLVSFDVNKPSDGGGDAFSCSAYTKAMEQAYLGMFGEGGAPAFTAVPRALSRLWESTGLHAWKIAQFGTSSSGGVNPFGERVYCRLLDHRAGVPFWSSAGITGNALSDAGYAVPDSLGAWATPNSIAWSPVNDKTTDTSLVGWAVCMPTKDLDGWTEAPLPPGLQGDIAALVGEAGNPDQIGNALQQDADGGFGNDIAGKKGGKGCAGWWWQPAVAGSGGFDDGGSAFWAGASDGDVIDRTQYDNDSSGTVIAPDARAFLLTTHGAMAQSMVQVGFAYLISSLTMFIVFGVMSLVVIVAKSVLMLMMLGIFIVMLVAIFTPSDSGVKNLGKFAKSALGIMMMTAMLSLILSLMAALTTIISQLGEKMLSSAPMWMSMFWTGLSPIAAVFFLKFLFTNVLKAPNPFSLKGMKSWGSMGMMMGGATAGAVGGVVGGGMVKNTIGRAVSRSTSQAINATTRKVKGAVADHVPSSRKRRSGSAAPVSSATGGATGPGGEGRPGGRKGGSTGPGAGRGDATRAAEALGDDARKTNVDALTPPKPWEEMDERERREWEKQVSRARDKDAREQLKADRQDAVGENAGRLRRLGALGSQYMEGIWGRSEAMDGAMHRYRTRFQKNQLEAAAKHEADADTYGRVRRTIAGAHSAVRAAAATTAESAARGMKRQWEAAKARPVKTAAKAVAGAGALVLAGPAAAAIYPGYKLARRALTGETVNTMLGASRARAWMRDDAARRAQEAADVHNTKSYEEQLAEQEAKRERARQAQSDQDRAASEELEAAQARAERAARAANPSRATRRRMNNPGPATPPARRSRRR